MDRYLHRQVQFTSSRLSIPLIATLQTGRHDDEVKLSNTNKVPTFYAGKPSEHQRWVADLIAAIVSVIFGAIHCIAWSFSYPSHIEQLLWQISSAAITGGPAIWTVTFSILVFKPNLPKWIINCFIVLGTIAVPVYIIARVILLGLTITTLRSLPETAYQSVYWATFIPHI